MSATILVVDDNYINLELACDVLGCEGHSVLRAQDAQSAQEVLKHTLPDLILMDVQMAGMDGLTLTRLLKADPAYRHIPIVALTAFAMKGDEKKAMDAGCDGYITKPIDTRMLNDAVMELITGSGSRPEGSPTGGPPAKPKEPSP
jgi:CheY-like chemotaxis protein